MAVVSTSRPSDVIPARRREKHGPPAVCIIVENLPVPVDRRVWREACALRDAGYKVSIICPKGKEPFTADYEELEGIEIYRHWMWEASTKLGYLFEYPIALFSEFILSLRVFGRTRFKILQACNPPDTIFLLGLFYKLLGVRFIFDHHDLAPELFEAKFGRRQGLLYRFVRLAERWSFRVADVSLATNESFREVAIGRGGKRPDRVFVVRNCPDLKNLRRGPLVPEIRKDKPFLVVYVGFMGTQDGLSLLLDSIEYMVHVEKRQDTHFVLVGSGEALAELKAAANARHLDDYITFTGQVPHEQVATYLSNATVGVSPDPKNSLNDSSTMIKILEYMAFELPIVLFDLKEGRRIAGAAALYARPNDPIDFAEQVSRLLDTPDLRKRMGEDGRARIQSRLNWETEKDALLLAYRTALPDITS